MVRFVGLFTIVGCVVACNAEGKPPVEHSAPSSTPATTYEVARSADEWQKALTPEEFRVLRESGTEWAFSGDLWDKHDDGLYVCAACGQPLFDSATKFDSGTGWPSYTQPVKPIEEIRDATLGMVRTEVRCPRCGGHLGHVFDDGPAPTGLRYCINSASLDFVPREKVPALGDKPPVSIGGVD